MSVLPASLVVDVNVRANDNFATQRGFGIPLFLTSTAKAGKVDADNRTRLYANMEEVGEDWDAEDEFYIAAQDAFSQSPRPSFLKVGFYDSGVAIDAATLSDELDALADYDGDWYWISPERALRDADIVLGLIDWVEARENLAIIATNDEAMKDPEDTTSIAAQRKGMVQHTSMFYSDVPAQYPDFALAAYLSTYDLDDPNSSYTAAFKRLRGISTANVKTADVRAISGVTMGEGASLETGHSANAYLNIIGTQQVYPGTTLTPGVFIDEIHFRHWLIARCREQLLNVFTNNRKVPYTEKGMAMLAGAVRVVFNIAVASGGIAEDIDEETGELAPAYEITTPDVFSVPESTRKSRNAPAIPATFRYAGAAHDTTVNILITY